MSRIPLQHDSLFDEQETSCDGPKLTMLSFGAGQDSTALLIMYIHDEDFRKHFAPNDFVVVFADTGDEHDHTYEHLEVVKRLCVEHDIEFIHLTPDLGYHGNGWGTLREQYNKHSSVGSKAFMKTCSVRLKINPIYGFLEDYLSKRYNLPCGNKKAHKAFSRIFGKINVLIGIAEGEESRVAEPFDVEKDGLWKVMALQNVYPLIQLGMNRKACQDYIEPFFEHKVMPSNCILCPWASYPELLWMKRFIPDEFEAWCEIEQNKFTKHANKGEKNLGVWGKFIKDENRPYTLRDALKDAEKQFGHWTDDDLHSYKMNHGCVGSKY